jgi:hypothetical protein
MLTGFAIGDRGIGAAGDTHPAWMMAYGEVGSYRIVGASAVGQLHRARNLPRDDAFVIRAAGPWLCAAVADGVGSRPLSRYGAAYTVESLTSQALRGLMPPLKVPDRGPSMGHAVHSAEPARATRDADEGYAPPAIIEALELRPWQSFTWEPTGREAAAFQSSPAQFHQVGSVGWTPSLNPAAAPAHRSQARQPSPPPSQFRIPGTTQEQDQQTIEPGGALDDADLVQIMQHAFDSTYLGLQQHAHGLGLELADLSCTALALLLNVETGRGAVGQIGDGALLALASEGGVKELVQDLKTTDDPQIVYTLNRANFREYLAINIIDTPPTGPHPALYIMTDGVSGDLLYTPHTAEIERWASRLNAKLQAYASPAGAAAGMLHWLSTYQVSGSWDDRTLVVILQKESSDGNRQPASGEPQPS